MALEFKDGWLEQFYEDDEQYRLIFQWVDGVSMNTYLDPHKY